MSNQTPKVIAADKGKFKNAVPMLIMLIFMVIVLSIGSIVLALLANYSHTMFTDLLKDLRPSDEPLISITIFFDKFFSISIGLIRFSTGIGGLLMGILMILLIIGSSISQATLTEAGIYGRNNDLRKFDLTFDRIVSVQQSKKGIIIQYVNEKGKTKKMGVSLSDSKKFADTCNEQLKAYKESATA